MDKLDLADFEPGGKFYFTSGDAKANPATVVPKICAIYQAIRPIVIALQKVPLIPKKWRAVIAAFVVLMDAFCP